MSADLAYHDRVEANTLRETIRSLTEQIDKLPDNHKRRSLEYERLRRREALGRLDA